MDMASEFIYGIAILIATIGLIIGLYFGLKKKPEETKKLLCAREGCHYGYNCIKYNCRNCPECKDAKKLF